MGRIKRGRGVGKKGPNETNGRDGSPSGGIGRMVGCVGNDVKGGVSGGLLKGEEGGDEERD